MVEDVKAIATGLNSMNCSVLMNPNGISFRGRKKTVCVEWGFFPTVGSEKSVGFRWGKDYYKSFY